MRNLLKYEFRKSKNVTLAILLIIVIGEVLFLAGIFAGAVALLTFGALALVLAATFGIFIVALLSFSHPEILIRFWAAKFCPARSLSPF